MNWMVLKNLYVLQFWAFRLLPSWNWTLKCWCLNCTTHKFFPTSCSRYKLFNSNFFRTILKNQFFNGSPCDHLFLFSLYLFFQYTVHHLYIYTDILFYLRFIFHILQKTSAPGLPFNLRCWHWPRFAIQFALLKSAWGCPRH